MTVENLIKLLSRFPMETKVVREDNNGGYESIYDVFLDTIQSSRNPDEKLDAVVIG